MNPLSRLVDAVRGRGKTGVVTQEVSNAVHLNPLCSNYENMFAQVRPMIDEMKAVRPFGVGRNGAKLPMARTPELMALDMPNEQMGWADFADTMFSTWLTERELNIHVWKNKSDRVYGYTILPVGSRHLDSEGRSVFEYWANGKNTKIYDDEVMTLRFSRSPRDLDKGVSPAIATMDYAQTDDLMAQYIKAVFENGAVPASVTMITASTRDKFDATKRELEAELHGAKNKNKTMYIWRQMLDDGQSAAQVEVKPIQATNSQLALKEIFAMVNDRMNKAVGVSNFILGDDSSAKYDNAELSDHQFTKRRVYPALLAFWSQFQHELDRIVGGLGYAIDFELEIPELTDRAKTRAEIARIDAESQRIRKEMKRIEAATVNEAKKNDAEVAKLNVENLTVLIRNGAEPVAAVAALGLGSAWLEVARGLVFAPVSQELYTVDKSTDCEHKCEHTHSHSLTTQDAVGDYTPVFSMEEKDAKQIYDLLMEAAEKYAAQDPNIDLDALKASINDILYNTADEGANAGAKRLQGLIAGVDDQAEAAAAIAEVLEGDGYHVTDEFKRRMATRTDRLVERFASDTQAIVAQALSQEMTASELTKHLAQVMPRNRAATIARNETVYAFRAGRLENDEHLARRYGVEINLVWRTSRDGNVCDVCAAMEGTKVKLGQAFPNELVTEDGVLAWDKTFWNDQGRTPDAHVNCRCYFDEEIA